MSSFTKTKLGQFFESSKNYFEINSKADGSELGLTVNSFNNFWNIINKSNQLNKIEALRSSLLLVLDMSLSL